MIRHKKEKILYFIYFCGVILLIFLLIRNNLFRYATDDDFVMTLAVSGAYGEYSPYMLYTNVILGWITSFFFKTFPLVNWITIFQLLGITFFFLLIGLFLIGKWGIHGLFISASFVLILLPYLWNLNYSKTAALVMLMGCFFLFLSLQNIEKRGFYYLALFMIVLGILIRIQPAILVLPFAVIVILEEGWLIEKCKFKRLIVSFIAILFSITCFYITNTFLEELHLFNEVDSASQELRDYGLPDYDQNREGYERIGVSENDFQMQATLHYGDVSVFSVDVLNEIADLKDSSLFSKTKILETLRIFKDEILCYDLLIFGLIIAGIMIAILPASRAVYVLCAVGVAIGEIMYMVYAGRWPLRVLFIPMISLVTILFYIGRDVLMNIYAANRWGVTIAIISFCILGSGVVNWTKQDGFGGGKEETYAIIDELKIHEQNLYIWDPQSSSRLLDLFSPYQAPERGLLSNIAFDCGWEVELPANIHKVLNYMDEYNVYKNSINSNVYFVGDNSINIKRQYIREHYHPDVDYSILRILYGEPIISFTNNFEKLEEKHFDWQLEAFTIVDEGLVDVSCNVNLNEIDGKKQVYLVISDEHDKKHTYELESWKNDIFGATIPFDTWEDSEDISIKVIIGAEDGMVESKDSVSLSLGNIA